MTGFMRKAQVSGSCQWFGGPAVRTRTFETFLAYPTQPRSGCCGSWHHICIQVKEMSFLSFFITKVGASLPTSVGSLLLARVARRVGD